MVKLLNKNNNNLQFFQKCRDNFHFFSHQTSVFLNQPSHLKFSHSHQQTDHYLPTPMIQMNQLLSFKLDMRVYPALTTNLGHEAQETVKQSASMAKLLILTLSTFLVQHMLEWTTSITANVIIYLRKNEISSISSFVIISVVYSFTQ